MTQKMGRRGNVLTDRSTGARKVPGSYAYLDTFSLPTALVLAKKIKRYLKKVYRDQALIHTGSRYGIAIVPQRMKSIP